MILEDIAAHCRHLADLHGGTDLAQRLQHALDDQRRQREALTMAADEIARLRSELAELRQLQVSAAADR
jgi:hypothetical protein